MTDELRRAYATLGLPFGVSVARARRQYRLLVKRWHPDRFAADPVGQAEACERLAHINTAYHVVLAHNGQQRGGSPPMPQAPAERGVSGCGSAKRLSREQIDRMVESIGTQGPIDWMLGWFEERGLPSSRVEWSQANPLAIALGVLLAVAFIALHERYGHLVADTAVLGLTIVAALIARWISDRAE